LRQTWHSVEAPLRPESLGVFNSQSCHTEPSADHQLQLELFLLIIATNLPRIICLVNYHSKVEKQELSQTKDVL
jgi:integral membrane sensor domain MASE1